MDNALSVFDDEHYAAGQCSKSRKFQSGRQEPRIDEEKTACDCRDRLTASCWASVATRTLKVPRRAKGGIPGFAECFHLGLHGDDDPLINAGRA